MASSNTELIHKYLSHNNIINIEKSKQLAMVANLVARIPFGEARTIKEVLTTKKVGTCSGKHEVLKACLDELEISNSNVFCTFRWNDQKIQFPKHLHNMLMGVTWDHGHNFLKVLNSEGKYIEVDVTINPGLEKYGFQAFPENWDGLQSTPLAFDKIIKKWEGGDIAFEKKKLMNSLSPELQEHRKIFLSELFKWIKKINK
ncbi:hypothetical protein ACFL0L_00195 [Patescibacteria group bacterium]